MLAALLRRAKLKRRLQPLRIAVAVTSLLNQAKRLRMLHFVRRTVDADVYSIDQALECARGRTADLEFEGLRAGLGLLLQSATLGRMDIRPCGKRSTGEVIPAEGYAPHQHENQHDRRTGLPDLRFIPLPPRVPGACDTPDHVSRTQQVHAHIGTAECDDVLREIGIIREYDQRRRVGNRAEGEREFLP
jgi:hypothetical protein